MAADPVTGAVYVQFYDRRADPANRKTTVTLARSTDHGKTFTNYAWMDVPFEGEQVFLGDYTWLTARGDRVYGVWTEAALESTAASAPQRSHRPASVVRAGTADFSRLR